MRQLFTRKSLHAQLLLVTFACVAATAAVATAVAFASTAGSTTPEVPVLRWRLLAAVALTAAVSLAILYAGINRMLRPLHRLRDLMGQVSRGELQVTGAHPAPDVFGLAKAFDRMVVQLQQSRAEQERSAAGLATRTRTVDRLLEFSQGIQAAGKPEQVLATLTHFLQGELGLAGLALLSTEPDAVPTAAVRACFPPDLLNAPGVGDRPAGDLLDPALCPCLRQQLPRHFRGDGAPVRCGLDASLRLGPDHPAYCIPFTIGGKVQTVAHMLLPPARDWDDNLKQLAQTYVNTAQGTLVGLHLLAEAERTSMTDSLTGLYNRRSLDSLMVREVALADRHGHPLSLVMIDMDHFKEVNDAHGHAAGDHLLRSFAESVRATLRRTDLAFRYGGDEFVIALPQTTVAQAQQVVHKLRQAFGAVDFREAIHQLEHQPTLSVGVAERSVESGVLQWSSLLAAADAALYDAKTANRNCVRVYQPVRAA